MSLISRDDAKRIIDNAEKLKENMNDLIHANELIGKLHNTAFKDGDDREICYSVIQQIKPIDFSIHQVKPINDTDIEENITLKQKLEEALKAVEHNSKLLEEARRMHELCRKDGEIAGLKYAIRLLMERGQL